MENIRPIKTKNDYDWAIAEITRYFDNQLNPAPPMETVLDVLATPMETCEDEHYPINAPDFTGHLHKELAQLLRSASRASEMLNKHRALTMDMEFKPSKAWGIPAATLIQPYHLSNNHR